MKMKAISLFFCVALLVVLTSCGNTETPSTANVGESDEIQRLQLELELAQIELEMARLREQSEIAQTEEVNQVEVDEIQNEEPEPIPAPEPHQLVIYQQEVEEILLGEWFDQNFEGLLHSWVFNPNGRLYSINSHYVYHQPGDIHHLDPNFPSVQQMPGQWGVVDGVPRRIFPATYVELIFSDDNSYFQVFWDSGNVATFRRTPPNMPPQFGGQWLPMAHVLNQVEIANAARMRRFLGQWHLDASLWTFNEDGTGVIYSPAMGMHPANYRYFTFEVLPMVPDGFDAVLTMHFPHFENDEAGLGGRSIMYHVRFGTRSGGSIEFGDSFLLTRMFDINNTPFFDHQLETFFGIMDMIGNFVP